MELRVQEKEEQSVGQPEGQSQKPEKEARKETPKKVIIIAKKGDYFQATVEGHPEIEKFGGSSDDALFELISLRCRTFGFEICVNDPLWPRKQGVAGGEVKKKVIFYRGELGFCATLEDQREIKASGQNMREAIIRLVELPSFQKALGIEIRWE